MSLPLSLPKTPSVPYQCPFGLLEGHCTHRYRHGHGHRHRRRCRHRHRHRHSHRHRHRHGNGHKHADIDKDLDIDIDRDTDIEIYIDMDTDTDTDTGTDADTDMDVGIDVDTGIDTDRQDTDIDADHRRRRTHIHFTRWQRPIGCLKLQIIFHKEAINHSALLWKMTGRTAARRTAPKLPRVIRVAKRRHAMCLCHPLHVSIHVYLARALSLFLSFYLSLKHRVRLANMYFKGALQCHFKGALQTLQPCTT